VLTVTAEAGQETAPPVADPAVLTLAEAAVLLRIDDVDLERLAERQELPARRIGPHWRFSRAALMAWLAGDWDPAVAGRHTDDSSFGRPRLVEADMAAITGRGAPLQTPTPSTGPSPSAGGQAKPIGEAPDERRAEDIFLRGQRVLLGRGEVVVDVGQFYSRSDDLLLASLDDRLGLATVQQSTLSTLLVGRVGILTETELFASTSFHHQRSQAFLASAALGNSGRSELPGFGIGLRRTLLRESAGRPDIIGSVAAQIPTGDYAYGMGGGLVVVKSFDPVVVFANLNYSHAFRRVSGALTLRPEDRFDVSLGYSLGLNDTLAISTAVSGVSTGTGTFEDATSRRHDLFSLRFALTSSLTERLYLEPSVSVGLAGPTNTFAFGITVPYSF
jgi:excisionase family DNA binding protein